MPVFRGFHYLLATSAGARITKEGATFQEHLLFSRDLMEPSGSDYLFSGTIWIRRDPTVNNCLDSWKLFAAL